MRTRLVRLANGTALTWILTAVAALAQPASATSASTRAGMLPLSFEPHQTSAGTAFVSAGRDYSIAITNAGATLALAGGPSPADDVVLALRFEQGAAVVAVPEQRLTATARYLVGPPRDWREDVPLFERVRLRQVWPGVDAVFYGRGRLLEFDLVLAPGADTGDIRFRIEGGDTLSVDANGDLLIVTTAGTIRQHRPHAFQVSDDGRRTAVESGYRVGGDGVVRIELGAFDRSRPLTIDPVLAYATYLGGVGGEFWQDSVVAGVAVGSRGDLFVAGDTTNVSFGVGGTTDLRALPAGRDIFIARFNAEGSALLSLTYLGGNGRDDRVSLVRAGDGSLLLAGRTQSDNLPATSGAVQTTLRGTQDAFVARLDGNAQRILYLTYLGGGGLDFANAIAATTAGDAVVAGGTSSADFPRIGDGAQASPGGGLDAFVVRLAARDGEPLGFATRLGGSDVDIASGVGILTSGLLVVTGQTLSADFPLLAPLQAERNGGADAFVAGFDSRGERLFASYFGGGSGTTIEGAVGLASAPSDAFVIVGVTDADDVPTASAVQPDFGGSLDGFAVRFSWNGVALTKSYATYLGGAGADLASAVAIDPVGAATIVGSTRSTSFPPDVHAFDASLGGSQDAFIVRLVPDGTAYQDTSYYGGAGVDSGLAVALDGLGDAFMVGQTSSTDLVTLAPGGGTPFDPVANGAEDAFVIRISADADADGLPDAWENAWGLDPLDATGDNGGAGDSDRDWISNLAEYRGGTNPFEAERFFAEGATGTAVSFDTQFALLNPHEDLTFDVLLEFHLDDGTTLTHMVDSMGPGQRATVDARQIPGLPELASAQFATVVRAPFGVVADRTMTWDGRGYGSHAETAVIQPSTVWYLAEGATHSDFDLFYLLQNPQDHTARVRVTYLRPTPQEPLIKTYTLAPRTRFNIWVNQERFPDDSGAMALADAEISAVIEVLNGVPIVVERAMYLSRPGRPLFDAGHESAGVTRPATRWFLAEGATTRGFFDLFVLMANPGDAEAHVRVTYLLPDGTTISRRYGGADADYPAVAPRSRLTIWVDLEDQRLADTAVSTLVESENGVGIVVERTMWWPGPSPDSWTEAHNSAGATATGTLWALAGGEQGGVASWDTYVLIANTSAVPGRARVTLHYEDGTKDASIVDLNASSRLTVAIGALGFVRAINARFGITVQALPAASGSGVPQIVVERAMYSAGVDRESAAEYPIGWPFWPAGTNVVATRLR